VFSLIPWLSTQHCPHLPTSTVLPSPATVDGYFLPTWRSAANRGGDEIDRWILDHFIDPALHIMQAVSTITGS